MAWASIGTVSTFANSGNNQASDNAAVNTTNLSLNQIGILVVSQSAQTTVASAEVTLVTTVADSGGNLWTRVRPDIQNGSNTTMPGVVCSMWYTQARAALTAASSINVTFETTFSANYDESAVSCWAFSVGAGNTVRVENSTFAVADASSVVGSLDLAVPATGPYLRFRGIAHSGTVAGLTTTAGWSQIGFANSGALVTTAKAVTGEFLISSATTAASAPTKATTVPNFASIYAIFQEIPSVTNWLPPVMDQRQSGIDRVVVKSF